MMLKNKTPDVILPAVAQAFKNLGGMPQILYSDSEGSFLSKELNEFYKEHNMKHIVTRGHAGVVERFVRTLKNMMFKRLKHELDKTWCQIIHEILVTLNYIRKSSATGLTPAEARKPENLIRVKGYMERRRNDTRKYAPAKVGDFVSLYRKRRNFEEANIGLWSDKKI